MVLMFVPVFIIQVVMRFPSAMFPRVGFALWGVRCVGGGDPPTLAPDCSTNATFGDIVICTRVAFGCAILSLVYDGGPVMMVLFFFKSLLALRFIAPTG